MDELPRGLVVFLGEVVVGLIDHGHDLGVAAGVGVELAGHDAASGAQAVGIDFVIEVE